MIQLNELRIGNLFYFNNPSAWNDYLNEIVVISKIKNDITEKEKEIWKDSFGSVSFYLLKDKNETFNQFSQYIKPIPLTEEILLKCGGKLNSKLVIFDRFQLYYLPSCKEWYVTDLKTSCYMNNIKFLHEWQNFIFVMNSTELQINL